MNTTPKRFTAINDVTGSLIKSKSDNQDNYAKNWEVIFGNKKKELEEIITFPVGIKECNYNKLDNFIRSNGYNMNQVIEDAIVEFINNNTK